MLTIEEKKAMDSSNLDTLISKLKEGKKNSDHRLIEQMEFDIKRFIIDTIFLDLQKRAIAAIKNDH